jgi:hypothetical protein
MIVCLGLFSIPWLTAVPHSESTLGRLTRGMSAEQVYGILGPANQTNELGDGRVWWFYSQWPHIRYELVRFDSSRIFEGYVID